MIKTFFTDGYKKLQNINFSHSAHSKMKISHYRAIAYNYMSIFLLPKSFVSLFDQIS